MAGRTNRWWRSQMPPRRLGVFGIGGIAGGTYFLVIERNIPGAIIFAVTCWEVGCLAVADDSSYNSWQPTGRGGQLLKRYVDVGYSIRYGRGQRILRAVVVIVVVVIAAAVLAWTAFS